MTISIIDYNGGNISSVYYALKRLELEVLVSSDPVVIKRAKRVVFPGVGQAQQAMSYINEHSLAEVIRGLKQPFLGICLGMQILSNSSAEGECACLGIIPDKVERIKNAPKLPHVGWNLVEAAVTSPLSKVLNNYFYFVHSFALPLGEYTAGVTQYGDSFSSLIIKNNFIGVQFHPEKSGEAGIELLREFIKI